MVRATRRTRSPPRAVSRPLPTAAATIRSASLVSPIPTAGSRSRLSRPRSHCALLAVRTRAATDSEVSPLAPAYSPDSTRPTRTTRSKRSSNGPEMRDRYLALPAGRQSQGRLPSPENPQGQGLVAATSWNAAGKSTENPRLATEATPSSRGWRRVSRWLRGNSASSSRNRTP